MPFTYINECIFYKYTAWNYGIGKEETMPSESNKDTPYIKSSDLCHTDSSFMS